MTRVSRTKEQAKVLDLRLLEIVKSHNPNDGQRINWKKVSQDVFRKHSIKLNNKQCAQRYKNYSSKINNPVFKLSPEKLKEIFLRHCNGQNGKKIRNEMNLPELSQNNLKNILKGFKEKIGRIIKKVLLTNFSKVDFDTEKFPPNDEFRVIIVLFSTASLLHYYIENGIQIIEFRDKLLQFDKLNCQASKRDPSKKMNGEEMQKIDKMEGLRDQIQYELERILEAYQNVYNDQILSKKIIGLRELRKSGEKYIYSKSIILDIPFKICRDQHLDIFLENDQQEQKVEKNVLEENHQGSMNQFFANSNFFDQEIVDCTFPDEYPTFAVSTREIESKLALAEDVSCPKNLFKQEEAQHHVDQYLA